MANFKMRGLVDPLDHLTLLPQFNPHLRLTCANGEVTVCEMEVSEVEGPSAVYREERR